jgi:hypothetical protein
MTLRRNAPMSPAVSRPTETTRRGLAHRTWHRIDAAIREMNYAAGLVAAPSIPGRQARTGA